MKIISLVWLRRNLRLDDNKPLAHATINSNNVLPVFIFDTDILERFNNKNDRRLSFLANCLFKLQQKLQKFSGEILVLHGSATEIIPKLSELLKVENIYADQDYEPDNIKRDALVQERIAAVKIHLFCDHLLVAPNQIFNKDNEPFKVYTPYMKAFRQQLNNDLLTEYKPQLTECLATIDKMKLLQNGLKVVDLNNGPANILEQIGYVYQNDDLWTLDGVNAKLENFVSNKISRYKTSRDMLDIHGTSALSPYLRFGILSIRKCFRLALNKGSTDSNENINNISADTWVNELIWREFYAMILYNFPYTVALEFQTKYQHKLPWQQAGELWQLFKDGKTGYPIVDAAIMQLLNDGWMHNRARMIVASFLTKNLFIDWRLGEEFFAQYLMDYELASNVGGWQWSSSCGTDAQPYFRIFNPFLQGIKFDPQAFYIKKYLPNLQNIAPELLHDEEFIMQGGLSKYGYPLPIIDYKTSRQKAISIFKEVGN